MYTRGVGAYPDDPYYDVNRPSWLPYWIDDSAESAMKYGSTSTVGQMGGVVGSAGAAVAGGIADAASAAVSNAVSTSLSGTLVIAAVVIGGLFLLVKR
jgi:hypothetical protein